MDRKFEGITSPKNKDTKIWRYMDFSKFVWMLENEALFFANFKNFDDPWEGRLPYDNVIEMCKLFRQMDTKLSEEEALKRAKDHVQKLNEVIHGAGNYYISCWHMNKVESVAMWRLYSDPQLSKGIAIQSTYKRLKECLDKHEENENMVIGKVKYTSLIKWIHELAIYRPFIHKRESFEYEKELRAIIFRRHNKDKSISNNNSENKKLELQNGFPVSVSLKDMINNIYISPKANNEFEKLVKDVLKKYSMEDINVIHSDLYNINTY